MKVADCHGRPLELGDRIKTPDGREITITGMMRPPLHHATYPASECEKVSGKKGEAETTERCDGRYPVPQTSPPREEPFEVTYRCARPLGHSGPHGLLSDDEPAPVSKAAGEGDTVVWGN